MTMLQSAVSLVLKTMREAARSRSGRGRNDTPGDLPSPLVAFTGRAIALLSCAFKPASSSYDHWLIWSPSIV